MEMTKKTLSQVSSEAIKLGQHFADGSFGEPVGEMNHMIHQRNLKKTKRILQDAGWSAMELERELEKRVTPKWIYDHMGYFFQCCLDNGEL